MFPFRCASALLALLCFFLELCGKERKTHQFPCSSSCTALQTPTPIVLCRPHFAAGRPSGSARVRPHLVVVRIVEWRRCAALRRAAPRRVARSVAGTSCRRTRSPHARRTRRCASLRRRAPPPRLWRQAACMLIADRLPDYRPKPHNTKSAAATSKIKATNFTFTQHATRKARL